MGGPFRLLHQNGYICSIEDLVSHNIQEVHMSSLKRFEGDIPIEEATQISMRDSNLFEVAKILDHSGSPRRKSSMKFLVKWVGYSDECNSWEPWKFLRDNMILHEYLKRNRMKSIIQKHYK